MSKFPRSSAAMPADLPRDVRLQIVSTCPDIPEGEGWLHEIKHDGHRLLATGPIGCVDATLLVVGAANPRAIAGQSGSAV